MTQVHGKPPLNPAHSPTCTCCSAEPSKYLESRAGSVFVYCEWCYGHCAALGPASIFVKGVSSGHQAPPVPTVTDEEFEEYRQKILDPGRLVKVKDLMVALMNEQPEALVVWQDSEGVLHGVAQVFADGGPVVKMKGI